MSSQKANIIYTFFFLFLLTLTSPASKANHLLSAVRRDLCKGIMQRTKLVDQAAGVCLCPFHPSEQERCFTGQVTVLSLSSESASFVSLVDLRPCRGGKNQNGFITSSTLTLLHVSTSTRAKKKNTARPEYRCNQLSRLHLFLCLRISPL